MTEALQQTGVIAAALLAATTILASRAITRAWAMAGALVLTPVLLVSDIWDTPQIEPIRDKPLLAIAAALGGLALIAGSALLLTRRPEVFAIAAAAALPFRLPIESGGSTANLLVPLYLVVAAGALAWLLPRLRGGEAYDDELEERPPGALELLLAGYVVLYAIQATYSDDFSKALEQLVFFYVPFLLLFGLLSQLRWSADLLLRCFVVLVGLVVALAAVGYVEYQLRELLLNPKVIDSNQFESYFRVNSLFFDPNIYGRFLAIVMLMLAAALLWSRTPRTQVAFVAALAFLWGGLVLTFSQSSFAALLLGLAVLAALRWGPRRVLPPAGALVVLASAFVIAFPGTIKLDLGSSTSLSHATSGRADLISGGLRLFERQPVVGLGSGSFASDYRRHERSSSARATSASHTIPVTIAAEQGVVGLLAYLALLAVALRRLFAGAAGSLARTAVAASFAALLLHTMTYAAFLEDPMTWVLLGVGVALASPLGTMVREPRPKPPPEDRLAEAVWG